VSNKNINNKADKQNWKFKEAERLSSESPIISMIVYYISYIDK